MRVLRIAVCGDNDELHEKALAEAVEAIERVNGRGNVYRAWVEPVDAAMGLRTLAQGREPEMTLDGYEVTIYRVPLFGTWSWRAVAPDGRELLPIMGLFKTRQAAERDALRQIETHQARVTMSGEQLRTRVRTSP